MAAPPPAPLSWLPPPPRRAGRWGALLCAPLRRLPPFAASRFRVDFAVLACAYLALAPTGAGHALRLAVFHPPLAPLAPALIKALPVLWLGLGALAMNEDWPPGHGGVVAAAASARDAGAGMLFSAAGDVLLDLHELHDGHGGGALRFPSGGGARLEPRPLPDAFLAGMACFALAHLAYARAFLRGARGAGAAPAQPSHFPAGGRALGALAVAAAAAVVLAPGAVFAYGTLTARSRAAVALFASPTTFFLAAASTAYAGALAATLLSACASALGGAGAGAAAARRGVAGAVLFVLSDAALAWDVFLSGPRALGPLPHAKAVVMVLYYSAQLLIAESAAPPPWRGDEGGEAAAESAKAR